LTNLGIVGVSFFYDGLRLECSLFLISLFLFSIKPLDELLESFLPLLPIFSELFHKGPHRVFVWSRCIWWTCHDSYNNTLKKIETKEVVSDNW